MEYRPKCAVIASALALVGALIALVTVIQGLEITEGIGMRMALCLLSMVLFIGVAGSMSPNGQWTWRFLIFVQIICTVVPVLAYSLGAMDMMFCAVLVVISAVIIMLTTTRKTKRWVEIDRI